MSTSITRPSKVLALAMSVALGACAGGERDEPKRADAASSAARQPSVDVSTAAPDETPDVADPDADWVEVELLADDVRHDEGFAYSTKLPEPWAAFASDKENMERSELVLLEDGAVLGPANALHAQIRSSGGGAYSHWKRNLFFSASDNSDPRTNGRRYVARLPAPSLADR